MRLWGLGAVIGMNGVRLAGRLEVVRFWAESLFVSLVGRLGLCSEIFGVGLALGVITLECHMAAEA